MSLSAPERPVALELSSVAPTPLEHALGGSASWQWYLLAGWLFIDVAATMLLGPVVGTVVIGVLGVAGLIAFCDWWRPGDPQDT